MNAPFTVDFVGHIQTHQLFTHKERFEFNKKSRFHWLQRALLWGLAKLRCHAVDDRVIVTRQVIHRQDFIDYIARQQRELLDLHYHRGSRVLIGAQDFEEIMHSKEIHQMFTFRVDYATYHKSDRPWAEPHRRELCGMLITVVPWMKGILVLPKELDK